MTALALAFFVIALGAGVLLWRRRLRPGALQWHLLEDQHDPTLWRHANPEGIYLHTHIVNGHELTHSHEGGDLEHIHDFSEN
jgi:hypothetical protein